MVVCPSHAPENPLELPTLERLLSCQTANNNGPPFPSSGPSLTFWLRPGERLRAKTYIRVLQRHKITTGNLKLATAAGFFQQLNPHVERIVCAFLTNQPRQPCRGELCLPPQHLMMGQLLIALLWAMALCPSFNSETRG